MIEGKEEGFIRKRKARDKANLRFLKNRHWILPGLSGSMFCGMLFGASVALSFGAEYILFGALMGTWAGFTALASYVMKDLSK